MLWLVLGWSDLFWSHGLFSFGNTVLKVITLHFACGDGHQLNLLTWLEQRSKHKVPWWVGQKWHNGVHTLKLNMSVQMIVRETAGTQQQTYQTWKCGKFSPQRQKNYRLNCSLSHGTVVRMIWELGFDKVFALLMLPQSEDHKVERKAYSLSFQQQYISGHGFLKCIITGGDVLLPYIGVETCEQGVEALWIGDIQGCEVCWQWGLSCSWTIDVCSW